MESIIERRSMGDASTDAVDRGFESQDANGTPFGNRRPAWLRRHVQRLAVLDALAAVVATWLAKTVSVGTGSAELHIRSYEVPYAAMMLISVPTWLAVLATSRCYDVGPFGTGNGEARRVISASAHFLAILAVGHYFAHIAKLGRGFLIAMVPLAAGLTLVGRAIARYQLRAQQNAGRAQRRTAVLGSDDSVQALLDHVAAHPEAGVTPVAVLTPVADGSVRYDGSQLPVIGAPDDAYRALASCDADLLIVTGSDAPGKLRRLAWQLEGTGVDLMVAPTVGQLPGPQLDVRPVAGLPLLYVDHTSLKT